MRPVRVLIVEDSLAQRELIHLVLRDNRGVRDRTVRTGTERPARPIEVVGEAHNGLEAVDAAIRLLPEVITMDLQMPRLGGLAAIDRIMAEAPSRIVVVCAVDDEAQLDQSFRAVAAGALELVAKPRGEGSSSPTAIEAWGRTLRESIRLMAEVPVVRRPRRPGASPPSLVRPAARVNVVGVVASTGGPPAVAAILAALPKHLPVPIVVAQHIGPGFLPGFARWLAGVTQLRVVVASSGLRAEPGTVYLPPDRHDLLVESGGSLTLKLAGSVECPSGDALLESLAHVFGARACGVVLTGMGADGAKGVRALVAAGGVALAQEPASCTVAGMPTQALLAGATSASLGEIAEAIARLTH